MQIVDAQVHIWQGGKASPHHVRGRPDPFTADDLLAEMAAAKVDCAVLVPPTWDPAGAAPAIQAAETHPGRFAVVAEVHWRGPPDPAGLRASQAPPVVRGLRLIFNTPDKQRHLADGSTDWIWAEAERMDAPTMLLIPGGVPLAGHIARRHPGLRLCIDHLGIPRGATDDAAFAHLPELLALAALPNVSVKAGGLNAYSTVDAFPYPSLHGRLRQVYDAFGPERIFWASDLTRLSRPYDEVVRLFTEGVSWMTPRDREQIMGGSVRRWLNWLPGPDGRD